MINIHVFSTTVCLFLLQYYASGVAGYTFNPDEALKAPQIIRRHGYRSESHVVETEDGYLLNIHRIPASKDGEKGGQPILLMHGILCSSADWVDEGNSSLGFLLADEGYDVWLGNARGNVYSIGHTSLKLDSTQFWDFSWHEMGVYDLPAILTYISSTTGRGGDILYVGHSMGTTMFYVFSSLRPQIAKLVKFMVSMAPIAYMQHVRSPISYIAPFMKAAGWVSDVLGMKQFLPSGLITQYLTLKCKTAIGSHICENLMFAMFGADEAQYNEEIMPVVLAHIPAGTSTRTVLHYGQDINTAGNFRQYDYGRSGNKKHYGTVDPPAYNLTNIQVPTYLMFSKNDYMATAGDSITLSQQLRSLVGTYLIPLSKFNHMDFLYGKDALTEVYMPLLDILRTYK